MMAVSPPPKRVPARVMPSVVGKVTVSTRFWEREFLGGMVDVPRLGVSDGSKVVVGVTEVGAGFKPPQATRNTTTATLIKFSQEYENILIFIVLPAFLSAHKTTLHETKWLFKPQEKGHTPLLEDWFHCL